MPCTNRSVPRTAAHCSSPFLPRFAIRSCRLFHQTNASAVALARHRGLVAVSNTKETKLYRLQTSSSSAGRVSAKRVRLPGACAPPAHALAFTSDGRKLVLAAAAGDIRVVDLGNQGGTKARAGDRGDDVVRAGPRLVHCFDEHIDGVLPGGGDEGALPVSAMTLSASGKWLVSASVSGVVYVFDLVGMRHHWTAPRCGPGAVCRGSSFGVDADGGTDVVIGPCARSSTSLS